LLFMNYLGQLYHFRSDNNNKISVFTEMKNNFHEE
jgi:hypothetical protein